MPYSGNEGETSVRRPKKFEAAAAYRDYVLPSFEQVSGKRSDRFNSSHTAQYLRMPAFAGRSK